MSRTVIVVGAAALTLGSEVGCIVSAYGCPPDGCGDPGDPDSGWIHVEPPVDGGSRDGADNDAATFDASSRDAGDANDAGNTGDAADASDGN